MILTPKLRLVLRPVLEIGRSVSVLQQWWEAENSDPPVQGFAQDGEWVDVPVESE